VFGLRHHLKIVGIVVVAVPVNVVNHFSRSKRSAQLHLCDNSVLVATPSFHVSVLGSCATLCLLNMSREPGGVFLSA
jgi:hypothetical protein